MLLPQLSAEVAGAARKVMQPQCRTRERVRLEYRRIAAAGGDRACVVGMMRRGLAERRLMSRSRDGRNKLWTLNSGGASLWPLVWDGG